MLIGFLSFAKMCVCAAGASLKHGQDETICLDIPAFVLSIDWARLGHVKSSSNSIITPSQQEIKQALLLTSASAIQQPNRTLHFVAHSWGGVLLSAFWMRFALQKEMVGVPLQLGERVKSCIFFGTKRSIRSRHWKRFIFIDLFWFTIAKWLARFFGYLPARTLRLGSDDETYLSHVGFSQFTLSFFLIGLTMVRFNIHTETKCRMGEAG